MEAKAQILVVDDDVGLASNLKDLLEGQGCNVAVAHDGQAALAVCREGVFDLVLVDIKLPGMPGLELIDKLTDLSPPTEYIIITGHGSIETAIEGVKRSKVLAYETKPLDMDRILLLTRQVVERRQAETELRESEERYRLITDNMEDTVWLMDLNMRTTFISPSVVRTRGFTLEELQDMPLEQHLTPGSLEVALGEIAEHLAPEKLEQKDYTFTLTLDLEFYRKDGSTFWHEVKATLLRDNDGCATGLLFVSRDVTDRKRAEEALRENRRFLQSIFDGIQDGISVLDGDLNIVSTNRWIQRMYAPQMPLVGKKCYSAYQGRETPCPWCPSIPTLKTGEVHNSEVPYPTEQDPTGWIDLFAFPLKDADGRVSGIIEHVKDITDRKQAEEALRQSEERYRTILEEMEEGYHELDLAGNYTLFNNSMCRMLGYSRKELMGMNYRTYTPEEDVKAVFEKYNRVYRTGKPVKGLPYKTIRKDGSTVHAEVSVLPLRNEQGEIVGFRGIRRDVTKRKQAEEALRESEERYRTILDEMDEGYYEFDLKGNLTFCNDSYRQALGYSDEEITKMNYADFTAEEDRDRMFQMFTDIYRKGKLMGSFTCQALRKDGGTLTVESAASPLRDKEGQIIGFRGIGRDVTERRRMEEDLRQSEERYRTILEEMEDSYFEMDIAGNYVFVNDANCRALGYASGEMIGMNYRAVVAEEDTEVVYRMFSQVYQTGKAVTDLHWKAVRKDGSTAFAELSAFPLRNEQGEIVGFRGVGRDITERKRMELELKKSEEKYQSLVEDTGAGVASVDMTGKFTFVNRALCEMIGYTKKELTGKPFGDFLHPDDIETTLQLFADALMDPKTRLDLECRVMHKNGFVVNLQATVTHIKAADGRTVGFNAIMTDVTERKRMEEERRELEQKAHLASRLASVGEMASGIAHEINNPLTAVIGYSELLMAKDLPEDIRGDIEAIHEGSRRVAGVVKRLLTFAGQRRLERDYVNINEIIETTLALRTYELETGNVEVKADLDPNLPATIADGAQLQQVFLNLIINAEKEMRLAHGKGNLLVKTEAIDNTIRISFEDNGPGIASENLGRIFEPFFTTREVGQGTGLGLSVCHGIVSEHGGRIYVESQLRKGATFVVELPIVTESEQLKLAEPDAEEPRGVAGAKILAVDDEPVILAFLSQVLSDEGYNVETVDNASEALDRIKSQRYSLILLDIKMPGMSGSELYRRIQKIARSLARRVLFITGDVIGASTTAFLARTKAPHITKPFDGAQLKRKVNRMLAENP